MIPKHNTSTRVRLRLWLSWSWNTIRMPSWLSSPLFLWGTPQVCVRNSIARGSWRLGYGALGCRLQQDVYLAAGIYGSPCARPGRSACKALFHPGRGRAETGSWKEACTDNLQEQAEEIVKIIEVDEQLQSVVTAKKLLQAIQNVNKGGDEKLSAIQLLEQYRTGQDISLAEIQRVVKNGAKPAYRLLRQSVYRLVVVQWNKQRIQNEVTGWKKSLWYFVWRLEGAWANITGTFIFSMSGVLKGKKRSTERTLFVHIWLNTT